MARTSCARSCVSLAPRAPVAPSPGCSEGARLAVARLALPAGPGPDEAAGIAARSQPVAEVLPGNGFEQLDVGLEAGDERLPLGPGQRFPRRRVLLEDPLQVVDDARAGPAGQRRGHRMTGSQRPGDGAVPQRRVRVRGHVLPRQLAEHAVRHAEERADPVERLGRAVHEGAVAENEDLLSREQGVEVLKLLAVLAERGVVPDLGTARGDPPVLLGTGLYHVADRVQARRP